MRKERKQELMIPPEVPKKYMDKMQGKYAANFVVLVTRGRELFARCFHRYSKGDIREVQRYAFAKDGAVRYGKEKRDRIVVGVPKGDKDRYKRIAEKSGRKSLNALIVELLEKFGKAYEDKE